MANIHDLVFDSRHPAPIARFWASALDGYQVPHDEAERARLRGQGIFDLARGKFGREVVGSI